MSGIRVLSVLLLSSLLSSDCVTGLSRGEEDSVSGDNTVTIAVTRFDMREDTLELQYEIVNRSDHDVWICDAIITNRSGPIPYEVYVDLDGHALMIRRRLAVPRQMDVIRELTQLDGCYTRLSPGEKRKETFTSSLPIQPCTVLASNGPFVALATRLVLEIGFYDEDLPAKIRSILEIGDTLACTVPSLSRLGVKNVDVFDKYFGGLTMWKDIGGLAGFPTLWKEGNDRINVSWHWQINSEESSVKAVFDGLAIPR